MANTGIFGAFLPPDFEIVEGHNNSSYFWIMPVRIHNEEDILSPGDEVFLGIVEHYIEEISIEEDVVAFFLASMLKKYYDKTLSIRYRKVESPDYEEDFEWYLTHNVYSYGTIRKMLKEFREIIKLLGSGRSNPVLDELLDKFPVMAMKKDKPNTNLVYQDARWDIEWTVEDIVDFYTRFCNRMDKMMNSSPGFSDISFMGP